MADEGTLATTAEVLLAIGENASADQILEANTNIWIKWAEGDITALAVNDIVANYEEIGTNFKRYFSQVAANRAAWYAINQDQDNFGLATSQSKLNIFLESWNAFVKLMKDKADFMDLIGL